MIFDAKEITTYRSLSSVGETHQNVDFSQNPTMLKNEESIKISLTGKIQVNGGFNQTPMLISFDAIPDGSLATRSSVSTELSNSIVIVETTTINLSDSNAGTTFDLPSIIEHTNDEASDTLKEIADENCEAGRTNTSEVTIKSREKFFDLTRGGEREEGKTEKTDSRIEKRLDKYSANSRTAKQVFPKDYSKSSIVPSGKMDRTKIARTISEKTDEAVDKLDSRAFASPSVRFPNILGSVLVDKDSPEDQRHAIEQSQCRVDVPSNEANRSELDRSNTTDLHIVPLLRIRIEKPRVDSTKGKRDGITRCADEDSRNVTSGGCYRLPPIVRKLELPETTAHELQTSSNYWDSDSAETFPPDIQEATTKEWNVGAARFSLSSTRLEDDVLQVTTEYATNETFPTETMCNRCNDKSINTIRVRNMMAIVRFMTKLLRIIADEEPPCLGTQVDEMDIRVKNVIINASSHTGNNVGKQKSAADRTTTIPERKKENFTTTEWQLTISEGIPEKSSPLNGATFETEAFTLPSTSDEAFKNEVPSALFQTSTSGKVHAPTSPTFTATPKSFPLYELEREPLLGENASRKNISVLHQMVVEQNSSVSFNDSKKDSEAKESRLDDSQTNGLRPLNQDRSFADRLHFGKQEIASTTNFERNKIAPESLQGEYLAKNKDVGFRSSKSTGVANDIIRSTRVSRDALLKQIDTVRKDRLTRSKKKSKKAGISDRRDTRTKLLNSSGKRGSSEDWIGEHRATRRLSIDKKLRESREVPGGIAASEKVVLRRVRDEINCPRDPNFGSGGSDSTKIERHVAVNGPLAKLSTDDAQPTVNGGSSSPRRADSSEKADVIRYSSMSDNVGVPKIDEKVASEPMRFVTKMMKLIRENL